MIPQATGTLGSVSRGTPESQAKARPTLPLAQPQTIKPRSDLGASIP